MAQAATIKDFLVALGFKTDNAGLAKMQGALQGVELKAKSLNMALGALAVGAVLAVRQTASELDKLYFSSKRIGASAENINAYGNAISQMGGSAEDAIGTLESLAEKMRNSPGYEGMINSLGVKTKDSNGALRDRVEVMKDLSTTLAKMPSYQANAYANSLGIDQKTLLAMRDDKFIGNMEKYQKIQKELGMDNSLVKSGNDFMTQYRDLSMVTKTGFQVIVMQIGKALIPVLKGLNHLILMGVSAFSQMSPKIKEMLAVGGRFAFLAIVFSSVARAFSLIFRLLSPLKAFIRLLGLLRIAFLATPLGIIAAIGAAILALYNDYKTWKEGGKSFIDWSQWSKEIDWVTQKIKDFIDLLEKITGKTLEFVRKLITDPEGTAKELLHSAKEKLKDVAEEAPKVIKNIAHKINKEVPVIKQETAKILIGTAHAITGGVKAVASVAGQDRYAVLGSLIASGEGDYNSVNRGLKNGRNLGAYKADLSQLTINQILARNKLDKNDKNRMNAVGKYQIIASTMKEAISTMGLTGNEKFTPQLQEKIFRDFLIPKRKQLHKYLNGGNVSVEHAQYEASKEWASIPVPKGFKTQTNRISDGSMTYYDKGKGNRAKKGQGERIANELREIRNVSSHHLTGLNGVPQIRNVAPPLGNPNKSQVNSSANSSQSNVTIHQSFKTDMTINGAKSPQESANAVKRQQENSLVIARRNAQSVIA